MKQLRALLLAAAAIIFLSGCNGSVDDELVPWIDTHAHPFGTDTQCTTQACIEATVALMDEYGVKKTILMHPPSPAGGATEDQEALIRTAVGHRPDRFYYGGGGNTLNSLIQKGPDSGAAPSRLVDQFDQNLKALVDTGEVVVFGETTALHLSYYEGHAYEVKPANSALFLRLSDNASHYGIPIDIHIDVVAADKDTPRYFLDRNPENPETLDENVTAFEELLEHNRSAKIVLVHVGRDTTGDMSAELMGQLMADHDNLYLQLHPVNLPLRSPTAIVDESGTLREEWLSLLQKYSDRIVMGSDAFFTGGEQDRELDQIQQFLQQLPEDLAAKIGCTNAVTIYGLSEGC